MNQDIENIIKKWLTKHKDDGQWVSDYDGEFDLENCCLDGDFDLNDLADEVLKVVVETLDIEKLAELEHEQWENWSKSIASLEKLTPERLQRWEELWINYKNLPEDQKEHDRFYARKILQLLSSLSPNKENKNNE